MCSNSKYYCRIWRSKVYDHEKTFEKSRLIWGHRIKAITLALQANYQGSIPCGSTNKKFNNMEERTIKVTLEKAREWYKSNNSTLKLLALQAFSKEELEVLSFEYIASKLFTTNYLENLTPIQKEQLHSIYRRKDYSKISAPKMLRIIAQYYNNGWRKKEYDTGYFFYKKENYSYNSHSDKYLDNNGWTMMKHDSVVYPTIVYFKNEKDCREAFRILKELGKLDNLFTDF